MSNNLSVDQVLENQANKEVTINTATGQLDAALTEGATVSVSAGDALVSATTYRRNFSLRITDASVAGRKVTLQQIKKFCFIQSDLANTEAVDVVLGSKTVSLVPGGTMLTYTDGTANGLIVISSGAIGGTPYDVGTFVAGKPSASERIMRYAFVRSVSLPANLAGSTFKARVAASADTTFTVLKNGSSIGTILFASGGTTGAATVTATSFTSGDLLELTAPGSADATLEDISFSFAGSRT